MLKPQRHVCLPQLLHHGINRRVLSGQICRHMHDLTIAARPTAIPSLTVPPQRLKPPGSKPPLSILPLNVLLRSLVVTSVSSYNALLTPSLRILAYLANSKSTLLNLDANPLIHWLFKKTFYAQYCAGETPAEVKSTMMNLKKMGFQGIILASGKEIVLDKGEKVQRSETDEAVLDAGEKDNDSGIVEQWKSGLLETVSLTSSGDYVALKFSGAGKGVMRQLAAEETPAKDIEAAIDAICLEAKAKGVGLLFDAEQQAVQGGIDVWTLRFQQRYNQDRAVVFGTYQAYLQSIAGTIASHLTAAREGGFVLGVKLVRGAYMASDERTHFWQCKEDTDRAFDGIAEALVSRRCNETLNAPVQTSEFPQIELMMATHNGPSIQRCLAIQAAESKDVREATKVTYGQLLGMADEVSCKLVLEDDGGISMKGTASTARPSTYKYAVWGRLGECAKYLVRRAEENRDAALRARDTRTALRKEIVRRMWPM